MEFKLWVLPDIFRDEFFDGVPHMHFEQLKVSVA